MTTVITLTNDEWDIVLDALQAAEAQEREHAILWKGRRRESLYEKSADELLTLYRKIVRELPIESR